MTSTTLSPKFQIVIPKAVREALRLVPGNKFHVLHYHGRIELIPLGDAKKMRDSCAVSIRAYRAKPTGSEPRRFFCLARIFRRRA